MDADKNPYESPRSEETIAVRAESPADGQLGNTIGTWVAIGLGAMFSGILYPALQIPWDAGDARYVVPLAAWAITLSVCVIPHLLRMRSYRRRREGLLRGLCLVFGCLLPALIGIGILVRWVAAS